MFQIAWPEVWHSGLHQSGYKAAIAFWPNILTNLTDFINMHSLICPDDTLKVWAWLVHPPGSRTLSSDPSTPRPPLYTEGSLTCLWGCIWEISQEGILIDNAISTWGIMIVKVTFAKVIMGLMFPQWHQVHPAQGLKAWGLDLVTAGQHLWSQGHWWHYYIIIQLGCDYNSWYYNSQTTFCKLNLLLFLWQAAFFQNNGFPDLGLYDCGIP